MRIIKSLISNGSSVDKNYEIIITRCLKLKELDLYLNNLDRQALLYQKSSINYDNPMVKSIDEQNDIIMETLKGKILTIINNSNISYDVLINCSSKIKNYLGNDIDVVDMRETESIKSYKTYLIADTILNVIHNLNQKTL